MRDLDLLPDVELPQGFIYPSQFKRILKLGITDIEPWYVIEGTALREVMKGLNQRYPKRVLIPFARRQDNDDIACWSSETGEEVLVIHDFASPGYELRECFFNFYDWLRRAVEDLIEFDI